MVQVATKFGITLCEDFQFGSKGTPEYVRECCEASLTRLDMDYIDLLLPASRGCFSTNRGYCDYQQKMS